MSFLTLFFLLANFSWANPDIDSFLQSFKKIENQITRSSLQSCKVNDKSKHCQFEAVCNTLAERFDRKYLYENSKGEKLQNIWLGWAREAAIRCVGDIDNKFDFGPLNKISGDNVIFDPESPQHQKNRKKKEDRAESLFLKAKDQAVLFLKARIKGADRNSAQALENMIQRINAVQLDLMNFSKRGFLGDCDLPNAFFSAQKTSLLICPQLLDLPEGSLLAIMTHELGHAIDPCNSSLNYFQYPSGNYQVTAKDEVDENGSGIESSLVLTIPKVEPKDYPFRSTLACLQNPKSAGLALPTQKKQLQSIVKNLADPSLGDEDKQYLTTKKIEITRAFEDNPFCRSTSDSSHSEELFSDWFSAQVMAQIVSQTQSSARKADLSYESLLFVVAGSCPNLEKKVKNLFVNSTQNAALKNCSLFNSEAFSEEEEGIVHDHPPTRQRFERIVLAQPTLRKALQCPGKQQVLACP